MDAKFDNFLAVLGFSLCTITTALLFNPLTAGFYINYGRYFIYLALVIFIIAIVLTWVRAFKLKGAKHYILASIKTLAMCGIYAAAFIIIPSNLFLASCIVFTNSPSILD